MWLGSGQWSLPGLAYTISLHALWLPSSSSQMEGSKVLGNGRAPGGKSVIHEWLCGVKPSLPPLLADTARACELQICFHSPTSMKLVGPLLQYLALANTPRFVRTNQETHINTAEVPLSHKSLALGLGTWILAAHSTNGWNHFLCLHSFGRSPSIHFLVLVSWPKSVQGTEDSLDLCALLPVLVRTPGCSHSSSTSPPDKMIHSRLKGWSRLSIVLTGGRATFIKWRELYGRKLY